MSVTEEVSKLLRSGVSVPPKRENISLMLVTETVRQMVKTQKDMRIPSELVPRCHVCGALMTMNLRCDDTFVQDTGWYAAQKRYSDFLQAHEHAKILLLELGVGFNTPGIIKLPFWRMAAENPRVTYACLNMGEAFCPDEIGNRSVCIDCDLAEALPRLAGPAEI